MRYRKLVDYPTPFTLNRSPLGGPDPLGPLPGSYPGGDYPFGHGSADFLIDSAAAVAQLISTRLKLWQGEWFLDSSAGTPWTQHVVGKGTAGVRDMVVRAVILGTQGVRAILSYSSSLDPRTRVFSVNVQVSTIFGVTAVSGIFTLNVSPLGGDAPLGSTPL